MVVNHLVGNIRLLSSGVTPDTIEHKMMLVPLLWICRNFRAEAAAIFYKVNAQDIGNRYDDFYYCREEQDGSSCRLQNFHQSLHPLTREVHLLLDKSSVYFGQALKTLSRAPLDSWNFQEIRKLKLEFYVPQWQQDEWDARQAKMYAVLEQVNTKSEYYDWLNEKRQEIEEHQQKVAPTVKANISEFVCRIKQMVPTLREIELEYEIHEFEQDPENNFFDTLLEPLLRLAPRIVLRDSMSGISKELMNDIPALVHIDMEIYEFEPITQLIRRSAATLDFLRLTTSIQGHESPSTLIKDTESNYICYPRLRVLKLEHYADFEYYARYEPAIPPSAVPFPTLRVMHLTGCCPFGDDTVFRGNAVTLESLELKIKQKDIVKLLELGVFTPTSHPKLQFVKTLHVEYYGSGQITVFADYLQLLLSIAPNAAVQSFSCGKSQPDIPAVVSVLGDYPNIQVLGLPDVYLPLWDAITLIQSLPLLSDLYSTTSYIIRLPANVKESELPAYILSTYASMGKQFRCWHITEPCRCITTAARSVLLLALICPNFDYCAPPEKEFQEYKREFHKVMDLAEFKDHAPRLQRFLFSNRRYCMF